ncbi:extracellular solute-binding protein [Ruegeria haliotis]|uniref:extracellular solute-binding protein n=1 Tax=Ruegeria haliotis TaxID=2747601 RepID=UPI002E2C9FD3|nr:extracellular solute-binding protein [Ruegeria haliotis]
METHGAAPNFSFFADEEEGFNKLRTGFSANLTHPCLGALPKFKAAGLTLPIDTSRLENWDKILPALTGLSDFVDEDGTVWAVPFDWGNTGIIYRTDKIEADKVSVQLFADPEYAGRVSMSDNIYDAYALAIGLKSWENVSAEQVDQMSDFLRKVHNNVRFYWVDQGQLDSAIKSGEIELAFAWNATELALQADDVPVTMVRDADIGVASWACGYVHLKDGPGDDDAVYDYQNAITSA